MKNRSTIKRVTEPVMLHMIQNRLDGKYICEKSGGVVVAATIKRNGHMRVAEFRTALDAAAWLSGRDTHDLFGNPITCGFA